MMKDLDVSLNLDSLKAKANGAFFDIPGALNGIPEVKVVNGDPSLSIHVRVSDEFEVQVREAVKAFCSVTEHCELELF